MSSLPPMRRIVTSHNQRGDAIVARDTYLSTEMQPHGTSSTLIWSSDATPADVSSQDDKSLANAGFVNDGSVFRVVDIPPRSVGPLHRTISLDYIIVQRGSVVLALGDVSRTEVNEGDFVVQQATMHGWSNERDEWARLLAVMLPAKAPVIAGRDLQTELSALLGPGH